MAQKNDKYRTSSFQYTPVDQVGNIANKQRVIDIMEALTTASLSELEDVILDSYHVTANVNVTHPINELMGIEGISNQFWKPLHHLST